jgi:hypothetical protein
MDDDLPTMSKDELIAEVRRLRAGIRKHRDSSGHALCWHHPQLWGFLESRFPRTSEFLLGPSSCAVASNIGSHSTESCQMQPARTRSFASDES